MQGHIAFDAFSVIYAPMKIGRLLQDAFDITAPAAAAMQGYALTYLDCCVEPREPVRVDHELVLWLAKPLTGMVKSAEARR
ncbi:hypothetical protein [Ensifer adhaerens]|uniref:hypothetical protein n=1 Tax=Ensifer adhaerens TaxID=106592 RepID=UPI001F18F902|nr:hypothetical protein [Ensifer adhaerens]